MHDWTYSRRISSTEKSLNILQKIWNVERCRRHSNQNYILSRELSSFFLIYTHYLDTSSMCRQNLRCIILRGISWRDLCTLFANRICINNKECASFSGAPVPQWHMGYENKLGIAMEKWWRQWWLERRLPTHALLVMRHWLSFSQIPRSLYTENVITTDFNILTEMNVENRSINVNPYEMRVRDAYQHSEDLWLRGPTHYFSRSGDSLQHSYRKAERRFVSSTLKQC